MELLNVHAPAHSQSRQARQREFQTMDNYDVPMAAVVEGLCEGGCLVGIDTFEQRFQRGGKEKLRIER